MSITRHSTTVPLKAMRMGDLRDHIVEEITLHNLKVDIDSISDDECILIITQNPLIKTVASLHRYRHRPMEIAVNVDYSEIQKTKDIIRTTKPPQSSRDNISFRWLWLLPVFGGLIITLITMFEQFFASFFGNSSLSQVQLIVTVTALSTILSLIWIYGVPAMLRKLDQRLRDFDGYIIGLISRKIEYLDEQLISSPVVKCWSCFEEIDPKDTSCSHCGEQQK